MLNEYNEAIAILNGDRFQRNYIYRTCLILAKYYKTLNYSLMETRYAIFDWGKKNRIYIIHDLNSIIHKAYTDKVGLVTEVEIKISKRDIKQITDRFDKFNARLIAFAMLCYAKKYADKAGVFSISNIGLSNWIRIDGSTILKTMKELIGFDYITKLSTPTNLTAKKFRHHSKINTYKLNFKLEQNGEYLVKDYNIREEYAFIISQN